MKEIKTLLIDGDIIMFESAHKADGAFYTYPELEHHTVSKSEMIKFCKKNDLDPNLIEASYKPLDFSIARKYLDSRLKECLDFFNNEVKYKVFLTGRNNFRYRISTISRYKGNRVKLRKPEHLQACRDYISENWNTIETSGEEADDAMGYNQTDTTCILSTDKDMNLIPGWHGMWVTNWNKKFKTWEVTELEALRNFYTQLIIGDSGDNILGLFGIAKNSVYVKRIQELETEEDMFDLVYQLYYQRFRNYAEPFMLETGRLLWIRRKPDELWNFPEHRG